jgi:hypothetical protein
LEVRLLSPASCFLSRSAWDYTPMSLALLVGLMIASLAAAALAVAYALAHR